MFRPNQLPALRAARACALALIVASSFWTPKAEAQSYPNRPIRWLVPFPPGGSTDIYSRVLGPRLSEAAGQQIVIDNRAGAGGALGAELAARAPNDGYTIWMGQTNNVAIGPALRTQNPYDPVRDYAPITLLMKAPQDEVGKVIKQAGITVEGS